MQTLVEFYNQAVEQGKKVTLRYSNSWNSTECSLDEFSLELDRWGHLIGEVEDNVWLMAADQSGVFDRLGNTVWMKAYAE